MGLYGYMPCKLSATFTVEPQLLLHWGYLIGLISHLYFSSTGSFLSVFFVRATLLSLTPTYLASLEEKRQSRCSVAHV